MPQFDRFNVRTLQPSSFIRSADAPDICFRPMVADEDDEYLRWKMPLHLWQGVLGCATLTLPVRLQRVEMARDILVRLAGVMQSGFDNGHLQRRPHVVLLDTKEFYPQKMMPILADWLLLWLKTMQLGSDTGVPLRVVRKQLLHAELSDKETQELDRLSCKGWKMLKYAIGGELKPWRLS